jgi:hypothetical protein
VNITIRRVLFKFVTRLPLAVLVLACATALVRAQTVTGTISGTVTDPTGQGVAVATVTVINEGTADVRTATTEVSGDFAFPALQPGAYTVKVESKGFQTFEKRGNNLTPNERLSLGKIQLTIGSVTESVTVTAQGATVQVASAEGSALLTARQLGTLAERSRDIVNLLRTVPGVQTSAGVESFGAEWSGVNTPNAGGLARSANNVTVDGATGADLGSLGQLYVTYVSFDAISEVKILMNNYQAEYGRGGGLIMNVVTKGGTKDYHGTAYWYKRHEMFNAQNFFNNRNNLPKPKYRYVTEGVAVGGPLSIPKVFNTQREKLFFYYSLEANPAWFPRDMQQVNMPTALERAGDFSQSLDTNRALIVVKDPLAGLQQFPGNIIPATRVNKSGQALLKMLPLPNQLDWNLTKGNYNYQFQESLQMKKLQNLFRIDYRLGDKDSLYFRGTVWQQSTAGYNGAGSMPAWGLFKNELDFPNKNAVLGYTRIVNASIVNELNLGVRRGHLNIPFPEASELAKTQRGPVGFTAGQLHPEINPGGIIPLPSFGGVTSGPSFSNYFWYRFPAARVDSVYTISDGLSITRGPHAFKVGFYWEKDLLQGVPGTGICWMGCLSFGRDTNNPFDANYAYANAFLGNFASYQEPTAKVQPIGRSFNVDWYVQDSWRVARRLTLELGLRVAHWTPYRQPDGMLSAFALERYNRSNKPVFYQPALVGGKRLALNPVTGQTGPQVLIGAFAAGDPANGMVTAKDATYPNDFFENPGELLQPRFGLAWDVFGNGKTAVRLGAAIMHQMMRSEPVANQPPIAYSPTIYYGNLDTFLGAPGAIFPSGVSGWDKHTKSPQVYNLTAGIQHSVGFGTVAEAKYVGTFGRNLQASLAMNTVPYGAQFLPQNIDPTTNTALPDNFFRPLPGFSSVSYTAGMGSSNYHAFQLIANRRFAGGVDFSASWNWSKTMDWGSPPTYRGWRAYNYGKPGQDQTHQLILTYTYDLPSLSRVWENTFTRYALDHWQVSGITTLASGTPSGVSFSTTDSVNLLGGGDGGRIIVTGKAALSHADRDFLRWFNTSVFARPAKGDLGNAPKDVFRGPGFNSWDITLFKNFPIKSERRILTFRWEMYNAFNHTQYSGLNTSARFDPAGAQTNALFGTVTSARAARVMQASLRFKF